MVTIFGDQTQNIKEKIFGLIGDKKPRALMIKTHFGIHTFGLKFPIDIIILDRDNKAVKLKKSLEPNNIFLYNPIYCKVLELPEGTIEKKEIKLKDLIAYKSKV